MLQKSEEPTPQAITQLHMHLCVCVHVCVRVCVCVCFSGWIRCVHHRMSNTHL